MSFFVCFTILGMKIRLMVLALGVPFLAFAQDVALEAVDPALVPAEVESIQPQINMTDQALFGETVRLDGSASKVLAASNFGVPNYSWTIFKNGEKIDTKFTSQIDYDFAEVGQYLVKLNVKQGKIKESVEQKITIYDRQGVLVTSKASNFSGIENPAAEQGVWLKKIYLTAEDGTFSEEESFVTKFQENSEFVREANYYLFAAESHAGIQGFAQYWNRLSDDRKINLDDKIVVKIAPKATGKLERLLQPLFELLDKTIVIAPPEALPKIFAQENIPNLVEVLKNQAYDHRVINDKSRIPGVLMLSRAMSYFIQHGISQSLLYLLLSVPFLAFVVAFARQFVGVSTFGVFSPLMLALSFVVLGLEFGLMVFLVVLVVSFAIRWLFERVDLLYIPKIALLYSFLALSFFLVLGLAVKFGSSLNLSLTIFPMMVMATISEKFVSSQSSEGVKKAALATIETVFVALLAFWFVEWSWLKNAILVMPELVLLPIIGIVWLGKFTGLRVAEYFKFKSLLREDTQE